MNHRPGKVEVWRETVLIPTYGVGCLGLGLTARAEQELACVLQSDPAHTGAVWMTHPESRVLGL